MDFIVYLILAAVVSCIVTHFILPQILIISVAKNLVDIPNERSVHRKKASRLGGLSFMPVILATSSMVVGLDIVAGTGIMNETLHSNRALLLFGLSSIIALYTTGVIDDIIGVRYVKKFAIQIISASLITMSGVYINSLHGLFGIHEIPYYIGGPLSVIVMVYLINAVNLIDGIDGLCSGLTILALTFFSTIFLILDDYLFALLSVTIMGTLIPFFYCNVFATSKTGAKLFMGDTGSLTVGLMLSVLAIHLSIEGCNHIELDLNIVQVFSLVLIPFFDVVTVMLVRLKNGKGVFSPDQNHIHHRLLRLGLSTRRSLFCILIGQLSFIILNLTASSYGELNINILLLIDISLWILLNIWINKKLKIKE